MDAIHRPASRRGRSGRSWEVSLDGGSPVGGMVGLGSHPASMSPIHLSFSRCPVVGDRGSAPRPADAVGGRGDHPARESCDVEGPSLPRRSPVCAHRSLMAPASPSGPSPATPTNDSSSSVSDPGGPRSSADANRNRSNEQDNVSHNRTRSAVADDSPTHRPGAPVGGARTCCPRTW